MADEAICRWDTPDRSCSVLAENATGRQYSSRPMPVAQPRARSPRSGHGLSKSSGYVLVAKVLLQLVDLVEFVLKINAAEEECHDGVQTQAERLGSVEMLFKRVSQCKASDEPSYPGGDADKSSDEVLMRLLMMAHRDHNSPGAAKVEHNQHGGDDVKHQSLARRLHSVCPSGNDQIPNHHEERTGQKAQQQLEDPVQIGWIRIDPACLRIRNRSRVGRCCRDASRSENLSDGDPIGHGVTLGHVGQQNVSRGDVTPEIFEGIWSVHLPI